MTAAHDESAPMRECACCGRTDSCETIDARPFCRYCAEDYRAVIAAEAADCEQSDRDSYNYSRGV